MIQFKSNINCNGCVNAVTETLNKIAGESNWSVDTDSQNKVLTIQSDIDPNKVIDELADIGFTAEKI